MLSSPLHAALVLMVTVAMVTDLRHRRIPNMLTFSGLLVALLLRAIPGGPSLWAGVTGAGIGLSIGFLLYAIGALRAGDGKLLAACGAFLGPHLLPVALLFTALAGGVLGLFALAKKWGWGDIPAVIHLRLSDVRHGGLRSLRVDAEGAVTVPYGVAISIGVLSSLLLFA